MTKRRRQGWMLFLAGLLLLAGAWLLLKLLPRVDYFKPMIAPKETT